MNKDTNSQFQLLHITKFIPVRQVVNSCFGEFFLENTNVLVLNQKVAQTAVDINNELKRKRKQIDMADLFIAATAIANHLPFATLNKKHFERIDGLNILK